MGTGDSRPGSGSQNEEGATIGLALPVRETGLFKHKAASPILNFLSDNPEINVSIRQLSKVTPVSDRATTEAVDALEANELVETFHRGNAKRVQINRHRLRKPDDPVQRIPQVSFRAPVRKAIVEIQEVLEDVKGIILFGSVARGGADRQSDIDLWVLVGGDHMQQRHEANTLATSLGKLPIPQTFPINEATTDSDALRDEIEAALTSDDMEAQSGERYSFEILVETPQSIITQSDRVDAEQLFGEGITLRSTETLERVKQEVLSDE